MSWWLRITGLLAGVILSLGLAAKAAWANGLPVQQVRGAAGVWVPDDRTPVGVRHETLTFDFRGASPNGHVWLPRVTASYDLVNPSQVTQRLTVAFLYLDPAGLDGLPDPLVEGERGLEISWQGELLPLAVTEPPAAVAAGLRGAELHWLDPASGRRYAVHPLQDSQVLRAAVTSLEIGPRGHGRLEVRFRQPYSGCDRCNRRIGGPIWHYTYLLQPARHWAFVESLTIRVLAPPGMAVASEPALDRAGGGMWEKTFSSLPPGDLHLSIRSPGLGWVPWAGLAILVVAGVATWAARRRVRARLAGYP